MNNNKYQIIAETAFSHEGKTEYLLKQIDAAKAGKADIVKFQILTSLDSYYSENHSARKMASNWLISKESWEKVIKYAKSIGLDVLVLPLETEAIKFIENCKLSVDYYEVHSVNFLELPLLQLLSSTQKLILLGIGGRKDSEIKYAIRYFAANNTRFMYGFQSFPTEYKYLNMMKIQRIIDKFGMDVGYADHTHFSSEDYLRLNDIAYLYGSRLFEKHIVQKKGEKRIDYEAGIGSEDFLKMRERLDELAIILGDGNISQLNEKESIYRNREKIALYAGDLEAGMVLEKENIIYKQFEGDKEVEQYKVIKNIGRKLNRDVKKMTPLHQRDFEA